MKKNHYRIELAPEDAWIASDAEIAEIDSVSSEIRGAVGGAVWAEAGRRKNQVGLVRRQGGGLNGRPCIVRRVCFPSRTCVGTSRISHTKTDRLHGTEDSR